MSTTKYSTNAVCVLTSRAVLRRADEPHFDILAEINSFSSSFLFFSIYV